MFIRLVALFLVDSFEERSNKILFLKLIVVCFFLQKAQINAIAQYEKVMSCWERENRELICFSQQMKQILSGFYLILDLIN